MLLPGSLLAAEPGKATTAPLPERVTFNRHIRPILSNNCYACHGPDEAARKADMRLDTREGATADLGGHRPIVPGASERSELVRRITAEDPDERMPPADSGHEELDGRQIALIERWIEQGAQWQEHWSFTPVRRPAPPKVRDEGGFVRNAIDRFILTRLHAEGLQPSPSADRRTLIRRLSFDLIGLPPTPEQVRAFVSDPRPDAYERLVDRLLASPHYGERMAIHWLDLVRYADTVGYHGDQKVSVWPYRDYVIEAFNENMSYKRFTIEQLAGDLLEDPTREQKVAAGYNRLGRMTAEGGAQPKEYLAIYGADRVRNASSVWLGATLACAECHDHKFDPFTAKDFYAFKAFFADIQEKGVYGGADFSPTFPLPSEEQGEKLRHLDHEIERLQKKLDTPTPALAAAQEKWERSLNEGQTEWETLRPEKAESKNGLSFRTLDDGSVLVTGDAAKDTYTITLGLNGGGITAIRLEALPHESLPGRGPGRAGNGNFVLYKLEATIGGEAVAFTRATASFSQSGYDVAGAVDGDAGSGWAVMGNTGKASQAVFETKKDIGGESGATLVLKLHQNYGSKHTLGRFRISATTAERPVQLPDGLPGEIAAILETAPDQRDEQQKRKLAEHYRSIAPELAPQRERLAELKDRKARLVERMPTMLETVSVDPRTTRVLPRGNWMDDSGEIVEPAVPQFLPQPEAAGERRLTRLDLAKWLVSRENPLTARAFVNRLWRMYFGTGLSKVLNDLGSQGEWPTHPGLLDWLAAEFMKSGWDIKHTVKTIVMSGTYRQSSQASERLRKADPYNRLLARQSRFRLPAEMVRDNALSISGLLVEEVGGPSVKPYQPDGYYAQLNFPKREYQESEGEGLYRRGVYTHWQRTFLHPSLLAFDAPGRETCTAERPRSNTPLQALVLLNDPTYVEAARVFAERIMREGGADAEPRIRFAYRHALNRAPDGAEVDQLLALHERHLEHYRRDPSAARALIGVGEHPVPHDLDPEELAAWTSVARVILNLHETIIRP